MSRPSTVEAMSIGEVSSGRIPERSMSLLRIGFAVAWSKMVLTSTAIVRRLNMMTGNRY
jgi:hypothetical protein